MYGIRKTVITNSAVFVLDNSGSVHKWDSDDEFWSPNVLERDHNLSLSAGLRWIRSTGSLNWDSEIILIPLKSNVVDIVTDSTDARQHRNSLFVLSQSDRLAGERPKLIDFLKVLFLPKNNIKLNILVAKKKNWSKWKWWFWIFRLWKKIKTLVSHWCVNIRWKEWMFFVLKMGESCENKWKAAPCYYNPRLSRIPRNLRRMFKMTFQQAHRFVLLQVSNRDYNKVRININMTQINNAF